LRELKNKCEEQTKIIQSLKQQQPSQANTSLKEPMHGFNSPAPVNKSVSGERLSAYQDKKTKYEKNSNTYNYNFLKFSNASNFISF